MLQLLRRLASVRLLVALLAVGVVAGIGSYLYASSHALSPAEAPAAAPSLLKPSPLGTAPYQYIAYSGSLDATRQATAIKQYFAAFVISNGRDCQPTWGGDKANGLTSQRSADITTDFTNLRAAGGDAAVSFGGSNGTELAVTCNSAGQLSAAYDSVVNKYSLNRVDFDIEGPGLLDFAANSRRASAVASLQRAHPDLQVWVTLPVNARGLTAPGLTVIRDMSEAGVVLSGVNIMAMNYNIGSKDLGQQAIGSANAAYGQLRQLFPKISTAQLWQAMGITVMIGHNDTVPETLSLVQASAVRDFAASKHVGMLSMWNAGRDMVCPAESDGTAAQAAADGAAASISCSGVNQQPYDFLRALTITPTQ